MPGFRGWAWGQSQKTLLGITSSAVLWFGHHINVLLYFNLFYCHTQKKKNKGKKGEKLHYSQYRQSTTK